MITRVLEHHRKAFASIERERGLDLAGREKLLPDGWVPGSGAKSRAISPDLLSSPQRYARQTFDPVVAALLPAHLTRKAVDSRTEAAADFEDGGWLSS